MNEPVTHLDEPAVPPLGRINSFWPSLALSLALAGMLFLLLLRPIYDVDIFWQVKLGELILAHRGPVPTEPFAATHLGEPLPPIAWLGQAVYAKVWLLGGWPALRVFDALLWVGGIWVVALALSMRGTSPVAVLAAVGIGFMAAMPCASLRPQSFAALGFGTTLALVRLEWPLARTLLVATPLFVLWQNLHPSVSVAAIALAAAAAAGWVRFLLKCRPDAPWKTTGLTLIASAATFATPAGFSILAVSAYNARASMALGVNEWLPPWASSNGPAGLTLAAGVSIAIWLLIRQRERIAWEELAPATVLLAMTLTAHRFALFWGIAVAPILARILATTRAEERSQRPNVFGTSLASLALVAGAIGLASVVRPTHYHKSLPLLGIDKVKDSGVAGTIYGYYAWGGPLIEAGYPGWKVAFDGRYYRYTPEEWERYASVVRGEIGLAELERVYRPCAFLLRPGADDHLIAALRMDKGWREIHSDHNCVAFVRATSALGR